MLIDDLHEIVQPPNEPVDLGSNANWGDVTAYFGKSLPIDYTSFIDRYGTVSINGWLQVLNPFSSESQRNLLTQFPELLSNVSQLKEEFPENCPYPLLFEPGGLLPWGVSLEGDIFCWLTAGMSGKWQVVVLCRHYEPEKYELSMIAFLIAAKNGILRCPAIPSDWTDKPMTLTS